MVVCAVGLTEHDIRLVAYCRGVGRRQLAFGEHLCGAGLGIASVLAVTDRIPLARQRKFLRASGMSVTLLCRKYSHGALPIGSWRERGDGTLKTLLRDFGF